MIFPNGRLASLKKYLLAEKLFTNPYIENIVMLKKTNLDEKPSPAPRLGRRLFLWSLYIRLFLRV